MRNGATSVRLQAVLPACRKSQATSPGCFSSGRHALIAPTGSCGPAPTAASARSGSFLCSSFGKAGLELQGLNCGGDFNPALQLRTVRLVHLPATTHSYGNIPSEASAIKPQEVFLHHSPFPRNPNCGLQGLRRWRWRGQSAPAARKSGSRQKSPATSGKRVNPLAAGHLLRHCASSVWHPAGNVS
jgi:hypothetical protein